MKIVPITFQKGESQVLALFLLAIVVAIIVYLIWSGEIVFGIYTADKKLKVLN